MKDEGYVLNLDDYSDIGTHWIALYALSNNIKTNIFRIQAYDSIMCSQFCIGFFDYMLTGKRLTDLLIFFHQIHCSFK